VVDDEIQILVDDQIPEVNNGEVINDYDQIPEDNNLGDPSRRSRQGCLTEGFLSPAAAAVKSERKPKKGIKEDPC